MAAERPVQLRIGVVEGNRRYRGRLRTGLDLVVLGIRVVLSGIVPIQSWSDARLARAATILEPLRLATRLCEAALPGEIRVAGDDLIEDSSLRIAQVSMGALHQGLPDVQRDR